MVAFDSTILSILLFPDAELHQGGKAVEHTRERVDGLVRELGSAKEQILIPAPALCEVLVTEGVDAQDVLTTLRSSPSPTFPSSHKNLAVARLPSRAINEAPLLPSHRTCQQPCQQRR
jgi:hypothetical protein